MKKHEFKELTDQVNVLEGMIDLAQRQLLAIRQKLEFVAINDEASPQMSLPIEKVDS